MMSCAIKLVGSSLVVLLVVSCASASPPMPATAAAPDDGGQLERDLARDEDEPTSPTETVAPEGGEATEHLVFDAGDATDVPAEGVVAQPQRDPMPSLMGGVRFAPR
jgi:hypothetical protein